MSSPTAENPASSDSWARAVRVGIGVGLTLWVWEFSALRPLYMDEEALLNNFVGGSPWDSGRVLSHDQLAPPGLLIVERILVRLPPSVLAGWGFLGLVEGVTTVARLWRVRVAVVLALLFVVGQASDIFACSTPTAT